MFVWTERVNSGWVESKAIIPRWVAERKDVTKRVCSQCENTLYSCKPLWREVGTSFSSFQVSLVHNVNVGAWIPYHDRHSSIQSHAKIHMGMPPKGASKMTSTGPSSDTVEQATVFTATVNIQGLKGHLFALGGLALLVASCKSKKWPAFIYLGAPLGIHNPNVKFTVNKQRNDYLNPIT